MEGWVGTSQAVALLLLAVMILSQQGGELLGWGCGGREAGREPGKGAGKEGQGGRKQVELGWKSYFIGC